MGIANNYGEEKGGVEKGARTIIGGSRKKGRQYVVFAVGVKLQDKKRDGENGEDFSREVTYNLEIFWQVEQLEGKTRKCDSKFILLFL